MELSRNHISPERNIEMPLYLDSTTGEVYCQEEIELSDGKRDWKERKRMSLNVSKMMRQYDRERAAKIEQCGTYLEFAIANDGKKLHKANFCRERMCPMCQWRRSIKLRVQADKIYAAEMARGYQHIFVTLTMRNMPGSELSPALDQMCAAFAKWTRHKAFKAAFVGYYRAIEVTYNAERNDFHPHLHVMLTVPDDYFRPDNPDYWTHDRIMEVWRQLLQLDYDPTVHVEGVHPKEGQTITAACVELCKYPTKTQELKSSFVLETVDYALRNRRLIQWGGLTADIRRELQLDDIESGNLIHTDEATADGVDLQTVVYVWRHGFYCPMDVKLLKTK